MVVSGQQFYNSWNGWNLEWPYFVAHKAHSDKQNLSKVSDLHNNIITNFYHKKTQIWVWSGLQGLKRRWWSWLVCRIKSDAFRKVGSRTNLIVILSIIFSFFAIKLASELCLVRLVRLEIFLLVLRTRSGIISSAQKFVNQLIFCILVTYYFNLIKLGMTKPLFINKVWTYLLKY